MTLRRRSRVLGPESSEQDKIRAKQTVSAAGVPVVQTRYGGIIHDFVMVNSMHDTNAAKAAIAQAVSVLRAALHTA